MRPLPDPVDGPSRRRDRARELVAPSTNPVLMTTRARFLVTIVAARNLLLGAALLLVPERFTSTSYSVISCMPWTAWGVIMLAVAVMSAAAAITMDELIARVAVGASATLSLVWAVGFAIAAAAPGWPAASPAGVIVWASLTAKDFLICSYPMASPFEPIIDRISALGARATKDRAEHPRSSHPVEHTADTDEPQ